MRVYGRKTKKKHVHHQVLPEAINYVKNTLGSRHANTLFAPSPPSNDRHYSTRTDRRKDALVLISKPDVAGLNCDSSISRGITPQVEVYHRLSREVEVLMIAGRRHAAIRRESIRKEFMTIFRGTFGREGVRTNHRECHGDQ